MKKKLKIKNKQKQKQKQSIIVNINNSRKSISKPREKKPAALPQQPSIIPQPIYIPQITYAPPERQPFREESVKPPVFNPSPPVYNPPSIVPQQVQPSISSSLSSSIPSYDVTFGTIVSDDDSSISTKGTLQDPRGFNGTPADKSRTFMHQPTTLPPKLLLTSKKYLEDRLIYNERNFGNESPFSEEEYKLPSALEREIRPINQQTPNNLLSPFDEEVYDNNVLANEFGGVAAPFTENSRYAELDESEKQPRLRKVAKPNIRCTAITKSGTQCQNTRQLPNSLFCGIHSRFEPNEMLMRSDNRKVYPM